MGFWTKKVEWSAAGAGVYTDLGKVKTDAAHTPAVAAEETSEGNEVYAGTQDVYECPFFDVSKFDALQLKMKADELVDLRLTDAEDVAEVVEGFSVMVWKQKSLSPRTRQVFVARFVRSFI